MRPKSLLFFTGLAVITLIIIIASSNSKPEQVYVPDDGIIIPYVDPDSKLSFAGEELPMSNFDVRERLDRELQINTFWHSNTILAMKNAARYFPVIEEILAENGVPDDFKYLAVAESALRNETSPAGAKGYWQFLDGTARQYGLEISSEVDERFHLEKSTEAACTYLKELRERFGSWTLAAAAFNMGASNLQSEIDNQHTDSYYDMNLNVETSRYIFRMIALKEVFASPKEYGFPLRKKDLYPELDRFKTVKVTGPIENWGLFAKEYGTTYRMIKFYNPWLLSSKLSNPKNKTYEIKVPK